VIARISFLYGVAAYLIGVLALAFLIGFVGDLPLPVSVDRGIASPPAQAMIADLSLLAAFGLQHSVMARQSFKRHWTRLVPPALERSTYLLATGAALAVLFWQWRPIPAPIVWSAGQPLVAGLLVASFWFGWALTLASTFLINHFELFGLQQVYARLKGRAAPAMRFRTPTLYRLVRHPLYLGLLLGFWSTPVMTAGHLVFAAGATLYVLVGILFEERDLVARFGHRYRRYRREVGMLLPRFRRARHAETR
jgi:protein-S-isoprenylcysteine O-methyltransferase Ste14